MKKIKIETAKGEVIRSSTNKSSESVVVGEKPLNSFDLCSCIRICIVMMVLV